MSNLTANTFWQVIQYQWKPSSIPLTETIIFQGQKLFQVSLRCDATLQFLMFGLSTMGPDKKANVIITKNAFRQNLFLMMEDHESPGTQLFVSSKLSKKLWGNLTLHVYIPTSTEVPNYWYQRMDDLLGQQLWEAAVNKQGTDLELIAEGRRFPVHRFILAARCPGFATDQFQFLQKWEQGVFIPDFSSTLEQLLKFVYTGELVGEVSFSLYALAIFFDMKTLMMMYEKGLKTDPTQPPEIQETNENNALEIKPSNVESDLADFKSNTFVFSSTLMIPHESRNILSTATSFVVSEGFGIDSTSDMFSVQVTSDQQRMDVFHLFFYVHHPAEKMCYSVQEVACSLGDDTRLTWFRLVTAEMNTIQTFTETRSFAETSHRSFIRGYKRKQRMGRKSLSTLASIGIIKRRLPSKITFFVKLTSTVPTFSYKPRDLLYPNEIWLAATCAANVTTRTTDVEIIVGLDEPISFHAHRFILCARSPVFDTMLSGAFEEARTGVVRITDVDPDTFALFIKFLYSGLVTLGDDQHLKENLFALADKYDVVTLMNICRPSPEDPVDVE